MPTPAPTPAPEPAPAPTPAAEIDYDKLASIVAGKQSVAEEKVINSYFKNQGLADDERNEAIEMYKAYKASKTPNIDDLQGQISDYEAQLQNAYSDMLYTQAELEAYKMAAEIGVDSKMMPYLMRMADLSNVVSNGQIDQEALKGSLSKVLEDIPQLKKTAETGEKGSGGFKFGADTSGQQDPNQLNTELAKIFGVQKKG
jgi:hypothetical protein